MAKRKKTREINGKTYVEDASRGGWVEQQRGYGTRNGATLIPTATTTGAQLGVHIQDGDALDVSEPQPMPAMPKPVARPVARPASNELPADPDVGLVPKVQVLFTTSGGTIRTAYHDVIETDAVLVLVYDIRYTAGTVFYPAIDYDTPLAIKVGSQTAAPQLVIYFGHTFVHGTNEYVVFAKGKEQDVAAPPQVPPPLDDDM